MKRATRKWVEGMLSAGRNWEDAWNLDGAHDVLDSDARQRAEIRELRKAVRRFMLCASLDRLSDAQRLARGLIK